MIKTKERKKRDAEIAKLWRIKNPEKAKASMERYYNKHRDEVNKRARDKRKNDPIFRAHAIAMQKKWLKNNKAKFALIKKKSILRHTYGISLDEYNEILRSQNNLCAICGPKNKYYKDKKVLLCVDHCHKRNKVRGLLCHSCNRALGLLKDDIEVLNSAITYLKKHGI